MSARDDLQNDANRCDEPLARAAAGDEAIVRQNDIPNAHFVPQNGNRVLGLHPNAIEISADFNDPFPDSFWGGSK